MDDKFAALKKYNFWSDEVPELGFPRKYYIDKIFQYTGNKLIKVLVGQRRAGKSIMAQKKS